MRKKESYNSFSGKARKTFRLLRRRSMFVRLFLSIITACLITVLLLITTNTIKDGEQLTRMMVSDANSTALHISEQMESAMYSAVSLVPTINELVEDSSSGNVKVSDEMKLIRSLKYQKLSMPFLYDLGYYDTNSNSLYLASGKHEPDIFARHVVKIKEEEMLNILQSSSRTFVRFDNSNICSCAYIIPMRFYSSAHSYAITLLTFSNSSISGYLNTYLPTCYKIVSIHTPNDILLYSDTALPFSPQSAIKHETVCEGEDTYIIGHAKSIGGYDVCVCVNRSDLPISTVQYSSDVRMLYIWTSVSCLILFALVIYINYAPINRIVQKTLRYHEPDENDNELSIISGALDKQNAENTNLMQRINTQRQLLIDYAYEHLIDGKKVSSQELEIIRSTMPQYIVVCARSTDVKSKNMLLSGNRSNSMLYTVEHYLSGYIVVICRVNHEEEAKALGEQVQSLLGGTTVGISSCSTRVEEIHQRFMEASGQLETLLKTNEHFVEVDEKALKEKTNQINASIISFVDEHYLDMDISVTMLAEYLNMSEYTAGKLMRNIYGDNFRHIVNMKRLEYAKDLLLSTDTPVNTISQRVGFTSASYFIKVFRDFEGMTPVQYRALSKNGL